MTEAAAQDAATVVGSGVFTPSVVPNNTLTNNQPPPAGITDPGVTGIGQVVTDAPPPGGTVGLCTGTLINPRAVIFAAHCVNTRPADAYGSAQGGVALGVGFASENNVAPSILGQWIGSGWTTNVANSMFTANQVWYDPRSLLLGPANNFLQSDIAIATLDTPAFDIPQWAVLFSPLTAVTHAGLVGYGNTGNGTVGANTAGGFRRRAAENMLDMMGSINVLNSGLAGVVPGANPPGATPQTLYWADFDDPLNATPVDIDILRAGGDTPREAITAPGDSGGPLVIDQYFPGTSIVAGVLSGGVRFNTTAGPQVASGYGTLSFYQPLFLYWDVIVQNNPYRYASALEGDGDWFDPTHWIQDMDPNYQVIRNGALANDLPDTAAQGISGNTPRFGTVCNGANCVNVAQSGPGENSTGPGLIIPGGPGSTNFVPNNVAPNRFTGVQARYYDVTLSRAGSTSLSGAATIDRFTMANGQATLDVRAGGSLSILGDATIGAGLLNVDGLFNSGEMLMVMGVLTGNGTLNPTYLTSVAGAIAPNGADVGTLTIQGDVILASGNQFFVEVGRNGADMLRILADPAQGTFGDISLGGDLRMVKASNGPAPRHGQVFSLVLADGTVSDTFDRVFAQTGVLRPEISYLEHAVQIELRAGKFADVLEGNVHELAFAHALDALREGNYNALYGLYGEMDVMDFSVLNSAFSALTPSSLFDMRGLMELQESNLGASLDQRLFQLARGDARGFSVMGSPSQVLSFGGEEGLGAASELSFASLMAGTREVQGLPDGVTGFISGGYSDSDGAAGSARLSRSENDSMQSWHMSGGLEQNFGSLTVGIGAAYAQGQSLAASTGATGTNEVAQTVVYGLYDFGGGYYVSGMVGAGSVDTETERRFASGEISYLMSGETGGNLLLASVEAGVMMDLADGFTFTPRVGLRQTTITMDAFSERGGAETALAFDEQVYENFEARVSATFAGDFAWRSGWRFSPTLDLAAVGNLSGDEAGITARFIAAPDVPIYLAGARRDAVWGEVAAGVSLSNDNTAFSLRVEQSVDREETHEDRAVARFTRKF